MYSIVLAMSRTYNSRHEYFLRSPKLQNEACSASVTAGVDFVARGLQARRGGKRAGGGNGSGEFLKGGFVKGVPSSQLPSMTLEEGNPTADIEKVPPPLPHPPNARTRARSAMIKLPNPGKRMSYKCFDNRSCVMFKRFKFCLKTNTSSSACRRIVPRACAAAGLFPPAPPAVPRNKSTRSTGF